MMNFSEEDGTPTQHDSPEVQEEANEAAPEAPAEDAPAEGGEEAPAETVSE